MHKAFAEMRGVPDLNDLFVVSRGIA
jgi:hypothetical protein